MKTVSLQDVCEVNPKHDLSEFGGGLDISFVGMADVSEISHSIVQNNTKKLEQVCKGFTHFVNDDVIVAKITPCYENGKIAVANIPHGLGFGSTEFHVFRPDKSRLLSEYLFYFLSSPLIRAKGVKRMTGSAGQKRVPVAFFSKLQLPLPTLEEQKRIVRILDQADSLRQKRQKAISLLDDYLKAVFLEMFGDPVKNPKGWEIKSLKEITSKIGSGATPRGGKNAYKTQGISLIRSLNIHDNKFIHKNLAFIDDNQAAALSNVTVEPEDILLNITGASVCRCAMVDSSILPARVNQHVAILRPKKSILNPRYFLHLIISHTLKQKLLRMATAGGATREALTKQQIEQFEIPIPPIEIQEKFSLICELLGKIKRSMYSQSAELDTNFQALMQKSFKT